MPAPDFRSVEPGSFRIGAVIGSGIFIITGTAAAGESFHFESVLHAPILDLLRHGTETTFMTGRLGAGQGVALSFLITAIVCGFAALGYGELASMIPIAGSAYTYAYGWLGEIVAWIIGWDLILECAVSNMAVAVGSRPISTTAGRLVWTALAGAAGGAIFVAGKLTVRDRLLAFPCTAEVWKELHQNDPLITPA